MSSGKAQVQAADALRSQWNVAASADPVPADSGAPGGSEDLR
ncbi:hypothetical protein ACFWB5_02280 [Corynebacterium xerosis]